MSRVVPVFLSLFALGLLPSIAPAQSDSAARISVVHPGAESLRKDLQYFLGLTSKEEQEQWENIDGFLETFLEGVDPEKPLRVDFRLIEKSLGMVWNIPITDVGDFRNNIDLIGIVTKRQARDRTLYKLEDYMEGWMRIVDDYAVLVESTDKKAVAGLKPRLDAVAELLKQEYNVGAEAANTATSEDAIAARRKSFDEVREELVAALKRKPTETKAEFELRREAADRPLVELGRYYAEVELVRIGGLLDTGKGVGRLVGSVSPIEGSSLAAAVKLLADAPSRFSNVISADRAVYSGRLNFVLDQAEKDHIVDLLELTKTAVHERIDKKEGVDAAQKTARREVAGLLVDLAVSTAKAGLLDSFTEVTATAGGMHGLVAGAVLPQAGTLNDILKKLPDTSESIKVQMDAESEGDVKIHKVEFKTRHADKLKTMFGPDSVVWVGVSGDTGWIAYGDKSLEQLKEAIKETGKPNAGVAGDPILTLDLNPGPWLGLIHQFENARLEELRQKVKTNKETGDEEELERQEDSADDRQLAIDTFAAKPGRVTVRASRVQDRLEASLEANAALLTLVGKFVAQIGEQLAVEE